MIRKSVRNFVLAVTVAIFTMSSPALAAKPGLSKANNKMAKSAYDAIKKLGVFDYKHTDPELLEEILTKDMFLGDLESVRELLGKKLQKKAPLRPMVKRIVKSIVKKHPAVVEFLAEANKKGLIPKVGKNNDMLKKMMHHTYLLEELTKGMVDDPEFMVEVHDHLLAKREAMGIPSDFMGSVLTMYTVTGNLFEPIKTKTMDWVFSEYNKIRERGEITPYEIYARQNGTKFNILEASISENMKGYTDNAMTGIAMAINPPASISVVGDSNFIEYELSQEWISLYETWNLAFITGNVSNLNILYPKLLIPSVIDAKPDEYLFNRAIALWTSINFHLFATLQQKPELVIPNKEELATLWGEINLKYAQKYVLKTNGAELDDFSYMLGMNYDMLWGQLKELLVLSDVITSEEAQQLSDLLSGS